MRSATLGLAACLAVGMSCACLAQDQTATARFADTQLGFDPAGNYGNYTLNVTGPNGFHASAGSKTGTPSIDLRRFGAYDDGLYNYQLSASTDEKVPLRGALDNGRHRTEAGEGGVGRQPDARLKTVSVSGAFHVKGGMIVKPSTAKPTRHDKDAQ